MKDPFTGSISGLDIDSERINEFQETSKKLLNWNLKGEEIIFFKRTEHAGTMGQYEKYNIYIIEKNTRRQINKGAEETLEITNNIDYSCMCLLAQRPMHFFWSCLILTLYNHAKLCLKVYCINLQSHQTYGSSNCSTSSPTSGIFSLLNYIFFGWVMVLFVILLYCQWSWTLFVL